MTARPLRITDQTFHKALVESGFIREDESITRIVIDVKVASPVVVYVERHGDERLLDAVLTLGGVEITETGRDPEAAP